MIKNTRFTFLVLLLSFAFILFSCTNKKLADQKQNSELQSEIPTAQNWFNSFLNSKMRLSSQSLSWLEDLKIQAEELGEEELFKLEFVDRMTVLLLRRAYHIEKSALAFDGESLWELLLKDPRLSQWNSPQKWVRSANPIAYANKKNPEIPLLFLEKEGQDWNLDLKKSLEIGLRPLEVKYSRLGSTGLGLALNFLALRGERGVGDFLLKPLNLYY